MNELSFFNGETYLDGLPVVCNREFPYVPAIGEKIVIRECKKSPKIVIVQGVKCDFKNKCITSFVSAYEQ